MKVRKITRILTAVLLTAIFLTSCGGSSTSTTTAQAGTTAGGSAAGQPDATGQQQAERPKLVMWQDSWSTEQDDPSNFRVKEKIDEILNIDIYVMVSPPEGKVDKLAIVLSSGEQLDVVRGMSNFSVVKGYTDGATARLNELLDEYGQDILRLTPPDIWAFATADDGTIAGVPNVSQGNASYLVLREDLLAKYGMEKPKTLDEFETFLARMKDDGLQMYINIIDFRDVYTVAGNVFKALGGMYMEDGCTDVVYKDGVLVDYIRGDGFKEMVAKVNEWFEAGYIPRDIFSWTNEKIETMFTTGQIGAYIDSASVASIYPDGQAAYIDNINPDAYFTYCAPMTGGITGKNAGTYAASYSGGSMWITQNSKVKEKSMEFFNWQMADVNNYMLATYGVEGYDWEWVDTSTNTYRSLEMPEGMNNYGNTYYYFDYYGTRIKDVAARTYLQIYYRIFDQYYIHEQYVPKNTLIGARPEVFDEIAAEYSASDLTVFKNEEIVKFITGQRPMSEWDKFISDYLAMGGEAYDSARNDRWDTVKSRFGQ